MITRKEMKRKGKAALKKHYFIFMAACLIAAFFASEFSASLNFSHAQNREALKTPSPFPGPENQGGGTVPFRQSHVWTDPRRPFRYCQSAYLRIDPDHFYSSRQLHYRIRKCRRDGSDHRWYTLLFPFLVPYPKHLRHYHAADLFGRPHLSEGSSAAFYFPSAC